LYGIALKFSIGGLQPIDQILAHSHTISSVEARQRLDCCIASLDQTSLRQTTTLLEIPYCPDGLAGDPPVNADKTIAAPYASLAHPKERGEGKLNRDIRDSVGDVVQGAALRIRVKSFTWRWPQRCESKECQPSGCWPGRPGYAILRWRAEPQRRCPKK